MLLRGFVILSLLTQSIVGAVLPRPGGDPGRETGAVCCCGPTACCAARGDAICECGRDEAPPAPRDRESNDTRVVLPLLPAPDPTLLVVRARLFGCARADGPPRFTSNQARQAILCIWRT